MSIVFKVDQRNGAFVTASIAPARYPAASQRQTSGFLSLCLILLGVATAFSLLALR